MRQRDFDDAVSDFDAASKIDPSLRRGLCRTRGAAYLGSSRYGEGLAQIDQGLALGVKDPQKAYFNRAIAHERLGDVKARLSRLYQGRRTGPRLGSPENRTPRFTVRRPWNPAH